jgi:hypothetical protein
VIYGVVDGALLSSFPWLVTWRAFDGEHAGAGRRVAISLLALVSGPRDHVGVSRGYREFRGPKLAQANVGNAIASLPTLVARNPLASPLAHAILHIAAVAHNPRSNLFLPPHTAARDDLHPRVTRAASQITGAVRGDNAPTSNPFRSSFPGR